MEQNGQQNERRNSKMMFVILVSAVFCALATYTAITLVANRSASIKDTQPAQQRQVVVDGVLITLDPDPKKVISLPGEGILSNDLSTGDQDFPSSSITTSDPIPPEPTPTPVPPPPTPTPPKLRFINYTVSQGDNLYGIADEQNSSIELMALYGIDDDDLVPGDNLELPVANPDFCPDSRAYVIRDHDTVFSISQSFGTTTEAIRLRNGLNLDYYIEAADVICIPHG